LQNKAAENIAVLGAGSWGTAISIHLFKNGHNVVLWEHFQENVSLMNKSRKNPLLPGIAIPEEIEITGDLERAVKHGDIILIVVPSHVVRDLLRRIDKSDLQNKLIVNLAKGLERKTLKRMSQVINDVLDVSYDHIVTLYGPSHAEEVAREIPTAVVAASRKLKTAEKVQSVFMSDYFRVYTNTDLVGVEIGGSVKNVIAIASGMCDGLGLGDNSKAALITRGLMEITRLGVKLGAREQTFAGLSGVGDLIVTCGSQHSRNRYLGEEVGKGRKMEDVKDGMTMVAEGVFTAETVNQLAKKHKVLMPISRQVYKILFKGKDPRKGLNDLMTRDPVKERHNIPGEEE
jgi:glycerol-3-phosphate dehydrogenase (NAD(P)+)